MGWRVCGFQWEALRDSEWQRPVLRRGRQSRLVVASLYEDSRGNLWAGAQNGLWRWKPGPPNLYPMPCPLIGTASQTLNESNDGALLIATQDGIRKLVDGKAEAYPLPGAGPRRFQTPAYAPGSQWQSVDRNNGPGPLACTPGKDGCFRPV